MPSTNMSALYNLQGTTGGITGTGLTMSTNKLLGRGSASTGVIEEITLGSNLALAGTTLNSTYAAYNHIDNPDFTVSQRLGSTPAQVTMAVSSNDKWIDRWRWINNHATNTALLDRIAGSLTGSRSPYYVKFSNAVSAAYDFSLVQRISGNQVRAMSDTITISALVKAKHSTGGTTPITLSINLGTPGTLDTFTVVTSKSTNAVTITSDSTARRVYATVSGITAYANIDKGLQVEFRFVLLNGDSTWEVDVADVMINDGAYVATFVNPTQLDNERRCMKCFQKTMERSIAATTNCGTSNGVLTAVAGSDGSRYNIRVGWRFVVPMLKAPTITTYCPGRDDADWQGASNQPTGGSLYPNTTGCIIYASGGTSTANTAYSIHASAECEL